MINVNNAGSGINGGWVYATSPNAMNFSGTININSGVFTTDGQQGASVIQGTATVNVASGGVFSNHSSNGVPIRGSSTARATSRRPRPAAEPTT